MVGPRLVRACLGLLLRLLCVYRARPRAQIDVRPPVACGEASLYGRLLPTAHSSRSGCDQALPKRERCATSAAVRLALVFLGGVFKRGRHKPLGVQTVGPRGQLGCARRALGGAQT